jgi:hypothetical protein
MSKRSCVYALIAAAVIILGAVAMHQPHGGPLRSLAQTIHGR